MADNYKGSISGATTVFMNPKGAHAYTVCNDSPTDSVSVCVKPLHDDNDPATLLPGEQFQFFDAPITKVVVTPLNGATSVPIRGIKGGRYGR